MGSRLQIDSVGTSSLGTEAAEREASEKGDIGHVVWEAKACPGV